MKSNPTTPNELRQCIRQQEWTTATSGACPGYVQANLVMLPADAAFDFLLFCVRNPKPCPILDVLEAGVTEPRIARGADLRSDLPRYRIFKNGQFDREVKDISDYFRSDMVSFLLGCSFSFEHAMLEAGLPVRNIEESKNVSMYITDVDCVPAGPFASRMVTSMRPLTPVQAVRAVQVTTRFHQTHGAPVHMGDPQAIGIRDLSQPDFGDPVTIKTGEIPVFWACGVTSQLAATSTDLPLVITHSPGHMFVSDLEDGHLALF